MLEQAIVDATALKDAAIKNAEAEIIEKYSTEIREAVDVMLNEAPEEELEYAAVEPVPTQSVGDDSEMSGAKVLDLNLDQLEELVRATLDEETDPEDMMEHEEISTELEAAMQSSEPNQEPGNLDEEIDLENIFEDSSEIEISQEELKDIVEKLTLDFHPEKTGYIEKPQFETRQAELEAEALAAHDDSDDEEMDKLKEALGVSEKENENLKEKLKEMTDSIQEMKSFAIRVKETLSEVNLQNARLLYTNKTLDSDSLNGRQKEKIVEAISNSKTVEEAKVIYETLQGAVGEQVKQRHAPKSLSEAVTKRSSALLKGSEAKPTKDPNLDRMKRLAGIN
jgi:hypothetical protein|tara:strand:- start:52 stop:1065 length:1014 start_codon:yes stop_codon:yes gene_type:complete